VDNDGEATAVRVEKGSSGLVQGSSMDCPRSEGRRGRPSQEGLVRRRLHDPRQEEMTVGGGVGKLWTAAAGGAQMEGQPEDGRRRRARVL
jgi:hypothetical protein